MTYWKNIILFGIKSTLILKMHSIENVSTIKGFLKSKILSTDFHDIEIHKRGSDYTSRNQCRL